MTISDFLTFVGIVVSIVFGFIITRFCSIRDTRTRVIKDYYIEQLKQLKGRVDTFYHRITFGKLSARKIVAWNDHIQMDVKNLDNSVRSTLDIQMDNFCDILDHYYSEITNWEDYNDKFSSSRYIPNNVCRERLSEIKYEIDVFLNNYIQHINQANNYSILKIQYNRIRQSMNFYISKGGKFPFIHAIWERIEKHIWDILILIALIVGILYLLSNIKNEKDENIAQPLNEISSKQDSIYKAIQLFIDKYEPINVNTKTFNNSAFFNADKVDSVHIKLYQEK